MDLRRVVCGLVAVTLGASAAAGQAPEKRTLVATGQAVVKLVPDTARITFTLNTTGITVGATREENVKHARRVKETLAGLKLKNVEIEATSGGMNQVQSADKNPDGTPKSMAYQTRTSFALTVRNQDQAQLREAVAKLVDNIVEHAGNALSVSMDDGLAGFVGRAANRVVPGPRVEWSKENTSAARRKAIADAVEDALGNARALAGNAKIQLVETVLVSNALQGGEDSLPISPLTGLPLRTAARLGLEVSDNPEALQITVRVKVTCTH